MISRRSMMLAGGALALPASRAFAEAGEVPIGCVYPLSGASAQIGVDARHALETAADLINGAHDLDLPGARSAGIKALNGAKVRLIFADHQGDPQKGRAEAERLITQDKVVAVIGAFHSAVSATASVTAERYGVPYIAADSSSPSLSRRGLKFFFRPAAQDEMFSAAMFDFLDGQRAAGRKIESVALFYEDTIFGTDSSNVQRTLAKDRNYKVAADVKYRASSPSLTAEVQQLKSADADVLLPSSYTTDAILLVRTMKELGYRPRGMLAQAAGFSEKAVFDAVGDQLGGLVSRASFALDLQGRRAAIGPVNAMFKARANRDLNDNTARQLMAALILADALERAGSTDGTKVRDALAATDIPGARTIMPWKRVAFAADGQNVDATPVLIQYVNGAFVTVYPRELAAAPAIWPMSPA